MSITDEERAQWVQRGRDYEREIARLRDIINPGDAAAYEEGMAGKCARIEELRAELESTKQVLWEMQQKNLEQHAALALAHEAIGLGIKEIARGNNRLAMNALHQAFKDLEANNA